MTTCLPLAELNDSFLEVNDIWCPWPLTFCPQNWQACYLCQ